MRSLVRRLAPAALVLPLLLTSGAVGRTVEEALERRADAPPAESDGLLVPDAVRKSSLTFVVLGVRCRVEPADGALTDCRVTGASKAKAGLNEAALAVAGRLQAAAPFRRQWGSGTEAVFQIRFGRKDRKLDFQVSESWPDWAPMLPPTQGPVPIRLDDPAVAPVWTAKPTPAEIDAAWPAALRAAGRAGVAQLECRVAGGGLIDCKALAVFPGGQGVGEAALGLADRFRVAPLLPTGLPKEPGFDAPNPLHYGETSEGRRVRLKIGFGTATPGAPNLPANTPDEPVSDIVWDTGPTYNQMERFFPEYAQRQAIPGKASLTCILDPQGRMTDCSVEETPPGAGFAMAALRMARYFQAAPLTAKGRPVAGRVVNFPFYFLQPGP